MGKQQGKRGGEGRPGLEEGLVQAGGGVGQHVHKQALLRARLPLQPHHLELKLYKVESLRQRAVILGRWAQKGSVSKKVTQHEQTLGFVKNMT